jgi:hypothetical protein
MEPGDKNQKEFWKIHGKANQIICGKILYSAQEKLKFYAEPLKTI